MFHESVVLVGLASFAGCTMARRTLSKNLRISASSPENVKPRTPHDDLKELPMVQDFLGLASYLVALLCLQRGIMVMQACLGVMGVLLELLRPSYRDSSCSLVQAENLFTAIITAVLFGTLQLDRIPDSAQGTLTILYSGKILRYAWSFYYYYNVDNADMVKKIGKTNEDGFKSPATSESVVSLSDKIIRDAERIEGENSGSTTNIDSLWKIHGKTYDLTNFIPHHPGGKEALLLAQGREDATPLFESYHPFTSRRKLQQILSHYQVTVEQAGPPMMCTNEDETDSGSQENKVMRGVNNGHVDSIEGEPKAVQYEKDLFYDIIRDRVREALLSQGMDPRRDRGANTIRKLYYLTVIIAIVICARAHAQGKILGSFFLAVFGWLVGALGHDAGHFSVGAGGKNYAWINDLAVWGMSFLENPILWQHQHTYAHHSHTNSFDQDPDLHHFHTFLRVHRRFRQHDLYKNQVNQLYVLSAYALVVFGTSVWIPLGMLQEGTLYGMVDWTDRKRPFRFVAFMVHLIGFVGGIIILPFWVYPSIMQAAFAVVIHLATSGWLFAFFSQINHLNEPSLCRESSKHEIPRDCADPVRASLKRSWAAEQVESSNNFCTDSTFWYYLSNGLNMQIEHHLFPGLNHCHLHRIQPVVQATCEEYGVKYKNAHTWGELWRLMLDWLNRLADEPDFCRSSAS